MRKKIATENKSTAEAAVQPPLSSDDGTGIFEQKPAEVGAQLTVAEQFVDALLGEGSQCPRLYSKVRTDHRDTSVLAISILAFQCDWLAGVRALMFCLLACLLLAFFARLQSQLQVAIVRAEFPAKAQRLGEWVHLVKRACAQVRSSERLGTLLQVILKLGNTLNSLNKAGGGTATGESLDHLMAHD